MSDLSWWLSVESASAVGKQITTSTAELNQACEHIVSLLCDASVLLDRGSHATSAFLAITALEEIAKIHVGMFRHSNTEVKRSKDPLYKHKEKHRIAGSPTVAMGARLQAAIGEDRLRGLLEVMRGDGLIHLREAALYVDRSNGALTVPSQVISVSQARELLLLAVEAFDDAFVGYSNWTFEASKTTDSIFERWASAALISKN